MEERCSGKIIEKKKEDFRRKIGIEELVKNVGFERKSKDKLELKKEKKELRELIKIGKINEEERMKLNDILRKSIGEERKRE